MEKILKVICWSTLACLLSGYVIGCTANQRAKAFGGTQTINLPANRKIVNATWKDSDLWILTRPMRSNDIAEQSFFEEKASFGVLEGKVIFIEIKN